MKRSFYLSILAGFLFFLLVSFSYESFDGPQIPDDVSVVLIASCYDCHSSASKNKDTMAALNFEEWDGYRLTKKIGLLGNICELIEKNKMPPERYLDRNPDKGLTEKQKMLLCEWTEKESTKLMEGE